MAAVMAVRTRVVVAAAVATGEASRTEGAAAGAVVAVTTAAVVAMNPEAVEVVVEAEAAWAEVTVVASINLVALGTKDHAMTLNRTIPTTTPSSCRVWERMSPSSLWPTISSRSALLRRTRRRDSP